MIDTIVLRIHNVKRHKYMFRNMEGQKKNGFTNELLEITDSDLQEFKKAGITDMSRIVKLIKRRHSGEHLITTQRSHLRCSSGHYEFAYMIDYSRDFIEVNFSIPKFLHGSNILMFVDHIFDKHYSFHEGQGLEFNIKRSYSLLMKFIKHLFTVVLGAIDMDYDYVEIFRIDVCFNQIFPTKADALQYLAYQQSKHKKYAREESEGVRQYATSFMYVTQRYSAKVYHKGAEFRKNDMKQMRKINEEKKKEYFKVEAYEKLADRTLRYELTFRNTMINYLHKMYLFRKDDTIYQRQLEVYKDVESKQSKNDRISKNAAKVHEKDRDNYYLLNPLHKISKDERDIHRFVTKLINKRTHFNVTVDLYTDVYSILSSSHIHNMAHFSKELLEVCIYKLFEFVEEYQIRELPSTAKVEQAIRNYNSDHKTKLPQSEMLEFHFDLVKLGTFQEVAKFRQYSKATIYRYKDRFKKIGISENNLIPVTENGIPRAEINFRNYHEIVNFESNFLKKRPRFFGIDNDWGDTENG